MTYDQYCEEYHEELRMNWDESKSFPDFCKECYQIRTECDDEAVIADWECRQLGY